MVCPSSTCVLSFAYNIVNDDAQYQRDFRYPAWIQWVFAHAPFLMRWYRNWLMATVGIFVSDHASSDVL